jgi:Spy/CpxP family protein refolding chaperone
MAKLKEPPVFVRPYLAILAMLGALLGATVAARAQAYPLPTAPPGAAAAPQNAAPGAAQRRRPRLRMVLRQLDLTPAQSGQIRSIVQSFRASRSSATPMTRRQMLGQIEGVLTPGQRGRFEAGMHPHRQPQAAPQT